MTASLRPVLLKEHIRFVQAVGRDIVVVSTSKVGDFTMFVASVWREHDETPNHYTFLRSADAPPMRFTVPVRPGAVYEFDEASHDLRRIGAREAFEAIHQAMLAPLLTWTESAEPEQLHGFTVIEGGKA